MGPADMNKTTRLEVSFEEVMEIVREAHQEAWKNTISNIQDEDMKLKAFADTVTINNFLNMCDIIHQRFVQIYNIKE